MGDISNLGVEALPAAPTEQPAPQQFIAQHTI
jgi:hypothetical protein